MNKFMIESFILMLSGTPLYFMLTFFSHQNDVITSSASRGEQPVANQPKFDPLVSSSIFLNLPDV